MIDVTMEVILAILGLIGTVATIVGGVLIKVINLLIGEARELKDHLSQVEIHLTNSELTIAKILVIMAACKHCPHPVSLDDIELPGPINKE